MARIYKTVRLAYEAKVWLDELIRIREEDSQEKINNKLIAQLEKELFINHDNLLDGISINVTLNVTGGSVIEQAYRNTLMYSKEEWIKLEEKMIEKSSKVKSEVVNDSVTPRLYIDEDVLEGLEKYRKQLMNTENKRLLRLSYIIKLVIFAYYERIVT